LRHLCLAAHAIGGGRAKRGALVPDLPALRELDLAAAEIEGWFIVLGPSGVPGAVVRPLSTAINKVLAAPATAEKLATPKGGAVEGPSMPVLQQERSLHYASLRSGPVGMTVFLHMRMPCGYGGGDGDVSTP
jgi:hypothetical protein